MNETVGLLFGMFVLTVLFGALALFWEFVKERFICWERTWNHPEDRWSDEYPAGWAPRHPWLCNFADWITEGECHD